MEGKIQVYKRDGSLEEFQTQKIVRVVHAAGLNGSQADKLGEMVARWVYDSGQNPISTLAIRNKVISELENVNEYVAGLYKWYQKDKDKQTTQNKGCR